MPYDTGFFYCKAFEIPRSLAKRHFVKVILILFYYITHFIRITRLILKVYLTKIYLFSREI